MEKKTRPFGVLDQVGYVCGDMAGSFVNLFVDAYFLTFCTYVLGINPAWMATLFLVERGFLLLYHWGLSHPPFWRVFLFWFQVLLFGFRGVVCYALRVE